MKTDSLINLIPNFLVLFHAGNLAWSRDVSHAWGFAVACVLLISTELVKKWEPFGKREKDELKLSVGDMSKALRAQQDLIMVLDKAQRETDSKVETVMKAWMIKRTGL